MNGQQATTNDSQGSRTHRAARWVKAHPVASLALLAGGAALTGAEIVAAGLVGAAVTIVVARRSHGETADAGTAH